MIRIFKKKYSTIIIALLLFSGAILRFIPYFHSRPLWHDEASLASSIINRGLLGYFSPLEYMQKAPPLFMLITKTLTLFLGESEIILRLLPFISSIGALFLFYLLSQKVLGNKYSIIIANFLFAFNYNLIYYAQEFKQYSTDVLCLISAFILYEKLDFKNISYTKILKYSLISILLILLSHPMIIAISAIILLNLLKYKKENIKQQLCFMLPIIFIGILYFLIILIPTRNAELGVFNEYWDSGFITLNVTSTFELVKDNFSYYFQPNNFSPYVIILFAAGTFLFIKENKKNQQLMFLIILLSVLASLLYLFPIKGRVSLYLLPIIILLISKPFDLIEKGKRFVIIILLLLVALFIKSFNQYNFYYLREFMNPDIFKIQDSRAAMQLISENFKPSDCLVYNDASKSDFAYYSKYFNFNPTKKILMISNEYDKNKYFKLLDKLPKNQDYWFYYPFDYQSKPVRFFLREWAQKQNIKTKNQEFNYKRTYVLYIKR